MISTPSPRLSDADSKSISIIAVKFLVKNLELEIWVPKLSIVSSESASIPSVPSEFNIPLPAISFNAKKIELSSVSVHSSSSKLTSSNPSSPFESWSKKYVRIADKFLQMNLDELKYVASDVIVSSSSSLNDLKISSLPIISVSIINLTALNIDEISVCVQSSGESNAVNAISPNTPSPSPSEAKNLSIKPFRFVLMIDDCDKYKANWSIFSSVRAESLVVISSSPLNSPLENKTKADLRSGFNSFPQLTSSGILTIDAYSSGIFFLPTLTNTGTAFEITLELKIVSTKLSTAAIFSSVKVNFISSKSSVVKPRPENAL